MSEKKVIIVGAGIVGLCSAYYLQAAGHQVTIIDSGDGTQNCSVGNAGFFCPSHVIPLAAPGIITQGLKWMLNEKSPFYVKPSLNKELLAWGWEFKKASTKSKVAKAAPVLHALTTKSRDLAEVMMDESQLHGGYTKSGLLMVCKTENTLYHEIEAAALARSFGQRAETLSREEAEKLNPGLEFNMAGAVYFPDDTMASPHFLVRALQHDLMQKGVQFHFDTFVTGFKTHQNKIVGIEAIDQAFEADEYVITTGTHTGGLLKPIGLKLPMQGGKGYSFTLAEPPATPKVPSILVDGRVSMSPMLDGLRFSGTMEINGLDPKINEKRIEGIIDSALEFCPQFMREDFDEIIPWAGFRPCTPDGLPYLGRPAAYSNMIIAAGHAMLGLTLGPVSGKIVADMVSGTPVFTDISLLDPDRYR